MVLQTTWEGRDPSVAGGQQMAANRGQLAPPSIYLPKGGGAIRGVDEKFGANPVTGTGSQAQSEPLATRAEQGREGLEVLRRSYVRRSSPPEDDNLASLTS